TQVPRLWLALAHGLILLHGRLDGGRGIYQPGTVGVLIRDRVATQVAVAGRAGRAADVAGRSVARIERRGLVARDRLSGLLDDLDQAVRVAAQVRVRAGDQGQDGRDVRGGHRCALDGRVALPRGEPAADEQEAGDLRGVERPVRGRREGLPGRVFVFDGVGESGRAAAIPERQVEHPGAAGGDEIDPRSVVAVVGKLILLTGPERLVRVVLRLAGCERTFGRPLRTLIRRLIDHIPGRAD